MANRLEVASTASSRRALLAASASSRAAAAATRAAASAQRGGAASRTSPRRQGADMWGFVDVHPASCAIGARALRRTDQSTTARRRRDGPSATLAPRRRSTTRTHPRVHATAARRPARRPKPKRLSRTAPSVRATGSPRASRWCARIRRSASPSYKFADQPRHRRPDSEPICVAMAWRDGHGLRRGGPPATPRAQSEFPARGAVTGVLRARSRVSPNIAAAKGPPCVVRGGRCGPARSPLTSATAQAGCRRVDRPLGARPVVVVVVRPALEGCIGAPRSKRGVHRHRCSPLRGDPRCLGAPGPVAWFRRINPESAARARSMSARQRAAVATVLQPGAAPPRTMAFLAVDWRSTNGSAGGRAFHDAAASAVHVNGSASIARPLVRAASPVAPASSVIPPAHARGDRRGDHAVAMRMSVATGPPPRADRRAGERALLLAVR